MSDKEVKPLGQKKKTKIIIGEAAVHDPTQIGPEEQEFNIRGDIERGGEAGVDIGPGFKPEEGAGDSIGSSRRRRRRIR